MAKRQSMKKQKEKIKREYRCRECGSELQDAPIGFDALSFLDYYSMKFCNNPKCKLYRTVVVVDVYEETKSSNQ